MLWSFWEASFWERLGQRVAGSLLEEVVRVTVQPGARPDGRVPRGRCVPGWSPAPPTCPIQVTRGSERVHLHSHIVSSTTMR